jgi:xanthine dehydrogenase large subunit
MKSTLVSDLNVSGTTLYLDDSPTVSGMLYAAPVTSPTAHGKLKAIRTEAALGLDPSVRIIAAKDIPGENQIGSIIPDEPLLVEDEWEYMGQSVALVIALSARIARKAASLVKLEYDELPVVTDAREAFAAGSLILPSHTIRSGDPEGAFARCATVVSGRVASLGQEHVYLEPQGAVAEPREGGRMYVLSGTQSPTGVQRAVARVLGLAMRDVEVETRRLGGGFGGKEEQGNTWAALAALGAAITGKSVKLYLKRREDMRWTGKRHPYSSDYKLGLDAEGNFVAFQVEYFQNSGASCDLSPSILARTLFHATNAYRIPNVAATGHTCKTNLPPFTAFRGFGAPQGVFVIESAIDAAAREGGWDPVELRKRNLFSTGDVTHFGQALEPCNARSCVDAALANAGWDNLHAEIESFNASHKLEKRGAAILPVCFGVSFTTLFMNQGGALVHVFTDGSVSVSTGAVEMGQQVGRKIQVVAATTLGISDELVRVESTRTATVANTYPTAASTGSDINGMAALAACEEIRGRLLGVAAHMLGAREGELAIEGGTVVRNGVATDLGWKKLVFAAHRDRVDLSAHGFYSTPDLVYDDKAERGSPFAYHAYGCAVVSATVDVLRGTYRFDNAWIVHDVGESIDPKVDLGQIEGAFAQGLGWANLEELVYDEKGSLKSDTLSTYKLPDIGFVPSSVSVEFLKGAPNPKAVMRSKAIGEPPFLYGIAGYFALLEALRSARSAVGKPLNAASAHAASPGMYDIPMTPEKVLDYIQGLRPEGKKPC